MMSIHEAPLSFLEAEKDVESDAVTAAIEVSIDRCSPSSGKLASVAGG